MCENHDALLKAKPPDDHDIWGPHESPFIRGLIERWTSAGLERFGQTSAELLLWVAGKMHKPGTPVIRPGPMLRWSADDLVSVKQFLEALPPEAFTINEWMLVVDYLFQRYLPADALMQESQWQIARASMMGRVQSNIAAMSAASAAHIAMTIPVSVPDIEAQFGISETQRAAIEFGQARCAQYVTNVTDGLRGRIKLAITDWQEQKFLGTPANIAKQDLQSKLLDQFGEANRDWRRISITEAGEAANQGFIGAQPFGTQVKRIEQYRGACSFCARIDGNIYTVVSPDKRDKDGDTEVWAGKNNIGRSAAPRKRTPDGMVDRIKSELLWVPAGLVHPHCRGRWVRVNLPTLPIDAELSSWLRQQTEARKKNGG